MNIDRHSIHTYKQTVGATSNDTLDSLSIQFFIALTPQLCTSTNKEHMCDADGMRFPFSLI